MYSPEMESEEDVLHHNLMVNYLPTTCTSEDLKELFIKFGPVKECIVICDPQTEKSRGYGFVRFTSRANSENAMASMNGFSIEGKRLVVKKADVGKDVDGTASVYVAGFDHRAGMVRELKRIFSQYGTVLDVTQLTPQEGKKGVAFVKFARYSDAIAAVENVKHIRKQELTVKIASQTARKATNWQRQAKDNDDTVTLAQHTCTPESARNVLVLYHYPSADGIFAALAATLYFKNYQPNLTARDIAIIPHAVYRPSPATDKLPINQRMTDVYLLGYAGSPEYVQQLAHECNSVTILDHHAAARDCFAALNEARALPPSVEVVVDADRSGATLAWDYFTDKAGGPLLGAECDEQQIQKLRRLFDYSEDHALGRHYLASSRALSYALMKENLNYNVLENMGIWKVLQELDVQELIKKGDELLAEQDKILETITDKSFVVQIRDESDPDAGHFGQCLAVLTDHTTGIGEMAYRLAVKSAEHGLRAIGAVACQKKGETMCKVSLRAVNNTDEDTWQIAECFEGQGHAGASSFSVPTEVFQAWIVAQTPTQPMPRNISYAAGQLGVAYRVSYPEVYNKLKIDVTPSYFEVMLGTNQAFDQLNVPPVVAENMMQIGFKECPKVAAAIYPIAVHRDVLCLLPRSHAAEHVYLKMVLMSVLNEMDPNTASLKVVIMCSNISLAQHVYMVAQAYSKGTSAGVSCVCEPMAKKGNMLDCHILITTPNAVQMLCREGAVNLSAIKHVVIHDTDRMLQMYLKRHMTDVLQKVWADRKRSGVTVGMYASGSLRAVRQLASELMEKEQDQHVVVTVKEDGVVAPPEAAAPAGNALTIPFDADKGFHVTGLLEHLNKGNSKSTSQALLAQLQSGGTKKKEPAPLLEGQPEGSVKSEKLTEELTNLLKPKPEAKPAPFSGNVQSILNQYPNLQPAPEPAPVQAMPQLVMHPGMTLPQPLPLVPFPPEMQFQQIAMPVQDPMFQQQLAFNQGMLQDQMQHQQPFGKGGFQGKGMPLPPMAHGAPQQGYGKGKGEKGSPGKGMKGGPGFVPGPVSGKGRGPPAKGGQAAGGKGLFQGDLNQPGGPTPKPSAGKGGPPPQPGAGASDGMPQAGQAGPVYPWQTQPSSGP
jgi:RNA recognition motif-containing protein